MQEINNYRSNPILDVAAVSVSVAIDFHEIKADGSGTTFVWTSYLPEASKPWDQTISASKSVPWPVGIGAPGNEGVANAIKGSPNPTGYVELNYALTAGYTLIKNGNKGCPAASRSSETQSRHAKVGYFQRNTIVYRTIELGNVSS
jgi:ABC-type phosphate transport system substrate-binding protein